MTTKQKRQRAERVHQWTETAEHDEKMATDYRKAAATLQNRGNDLDALFLEGMAADFATYAQNARATIRQLNTES